MTTAAHPARPQRAGVTAAYDLGVDVYATLGSPAVLPAARAVVAALSLDYAARVLDLASGQVLLAAAPDVTVAGLEASTETPYSRLLSQTPTRLSGHSGIRAS